MDLSNSNEGESPYSSPCDDVSGPFYIRIYPHIIRNSGHTGGQTEEAVKSAINIMNGYFSSHGIQFIPECGIDYIDEDDLYQTALLLLAHFTILMDIMMALIFILIPMMQ